MRFTTPVLSLILASVNSLAMAGPASTDTQTPPRQDPIHADDATDNATRNKRAAGIQQLDTISVNASLDIARNALSPDTGSSQYAFDPKAIAQLPLGAATPINQVLLQAPGVVQDARGGMHVRGDHANLQYRINGVIIPESISGFGQGLDTRMISSITLLDGALPAQYGLRSAAVVDIVTRSGHELGNGGSIGLLAGAFHTLNPNAAIWGSSERWDYFLTGNVMHNDAGIENPTPARNSIHNRTNQAQGSGNFSYLLNDETRASFLFGVSNHRFQIPNLPGQVPQFGYGDSEHFDSTSLDERQRENTRFGVLSLQGRFAATDYQVALGQRATSVAFTPDHVGDLMFSGVANDVRRSGRASTLQADLATHLGYDHTLRYGMYASFERAAGDNRAWVFPADLEGMQTSTTPILIIDDSRLVARTWSAYVQDEWHFAENWTLNFGLRGDRYHLARSESQLSPRAGVVWQVSHATAVHAGYARYFTPPSTEMIASANIAKFNGTTNAVADHGNNIPLSERSDYFDLGVAQDFGASWTLGIDAYYRKVQRLQDEGQFGAALVYSTFNFARGRVRGIELTANYEHGPWSAYANASVGQATGQRIITSQYNFDPEDLAYIETHAIALDHDQKLTASGGFNYAFNEQTQAGANFLFGSGMRTDGAVPNGASLPAYFQLNLSLSHIFRFASAGEFHTQLTVLNALDRSYELRDGSGIGVGAPQFGPRRGIYVGVQKEF